MSRELRPYQAEALTALRRSLGEGRRRPMVQAPTGAGKTRLAAAIVEGALAKNRRVTFVVPALSLVDQTVDAFWGDGIRDIGVIQGNHELTNGLRPVQVASVQTLMRRPLPEADVVVIDEAHRWFAFYGQWMADPAWQRVPFIGLSATPWTKGLGKHFDELIVATTTERLIADGYLSPFRVYAPSHPDLSKVRTVAGDYHEGDLAGVMGETTLVADVVETYRRLGEDRPALCFAVDRAHAKHLQARFLEAGIATGYIDAFTEPEEREQIRRQFHDGRVQVVCNVGCLTTGVDWDVRCVILARPTKSEMLFVQIIGRGLRTAPGKADALILDHSDTHLRLGFVTDIHHDALDDGKPRTTATRDRKEPLPKECPQCSFLKPARLHRCPACGFAPERQSEIKAEAGELAALTKGKRKPTPDEKRTFFAELRGYARSAGKTDKWVLANFRARFNEWPARRDIAPAMPSAETLSWIRSRQIAWAKAKEKREADHVASPAS